MARRNPNVFSLAFLDAMTCGFGAVVLFFMIINAAVGERAGKMTRDLTAEVDRLDEEVLEGAERQAELRNSVREIDHDRVRVQGLSRRILERLETLREELATHDQSTLASREHINKLKSELLSLEADTKRLQALASSDDTPGDRVRSFVGDGDRQYLTGLKVGGERVLILVDVSASMLDETIVNIVRRRLLADDVKRRALKWQRAVRTVDWLTTQLPARSRFQIHTFDVRARAILPGTDGTWLDSSDRAALDAAIARLRNTVPGGGTSLHRAFESLATLRPAPDNVILVTDGLPTQGDRPPKRTTIKARDRLKLYNRAVERLPRGIPINIILLPMEGDPMAAAAFWKLALATDGSFLSPPKDWP